MSYRLARPSHRTLAGVVAVALLIGSGSMANARQPAKPADSVLATDVRGYLDKDQLPDSLHLVPPPPQVGSAALANDEAIAKAMLALRGTPRWELAAQDAVLGFPAAASHFSCALGVQIDPASTPHLLRLLERSMRDASTSTSAAKARYQRARPFMRNDQPMCTPADDAALRKNGSYPSGHTAIGWSWGLILSEIAPPTATPCSPAAAPSATAAWSAMCTGKAMSSRAACWAPPLSPPCMATQHSKRIWPPPAARSKRRRRSRPLQPRWPRARRKTKRCRRCCLV